MGYVCYTALHMLHCFWRRQAVHWWDTAANWLLVGWLSGAVTTL